MAFAVLAKQNYALLLPTLVAASVLARLVNRALVLVRLRDAVKMTVGLAVIGILFAGYLLVSGDLSEFCHQVIDYPQLANAVSLKFAFVQDNFAALRQALPLVLLFCLLYLVRRKWLTAIVLGIPAVVFFGPPLIASAKEFTYVLVCINYGAACVAFYRYKEIPSAGREQMRAILPMLCFALVIQYLSGFNFGGLFFACIGAGIALPVTFVVLKQASRRRADRITASVAVLCLVAIAGYHKFTYIYHDAPRRDLTATYTTGKLRGVRSVPKLVKHTETILASIRAHSRPGEYIFTYPNYSSYYYLSDRNNPATIDWYYRLDNAAEIVDQSLQPLLTNNPRVILLGTTKLPPTLKKLVDDKYAVCEQVDEVRICIPK